MQAIKVFSSFLFGMVFLSSQAFAGKKPASQALNELRNGQQTASDAVLNRFFLKQGRFELAPIVGYVPNNPMVKRYTTGVLSAFHFNENIAAEGAFIYSPDLGNSDLKGLTRTLVDIAAKGSGKVNFQQPLEKMLLGATFAARWAPIYGKINLLGESVLNFDFYGVAGVGMLSSNTYFASFDESTQDTVLSTPGRETRIPVNLGFGMNFFLSQSIAFKIDGRSYLYRALKPDYDPSPTVNPTESRLYNTFVASVGVSVFIPKMRPRLMEF